MGGNSLYAKIVAVRCVMTSCRTPCRHVCMQRMLYNVLWLLVGRHVNKCNWKLCFITTCRTPCIYLDMQRIFWTMYYDYMTNDKNTNKDIRHLLGFFFVWHLSNISYLSDKYLDPTITDRHLSSCCMQSTMENAVCNGICWFQDEGRVQMTPARIARILSSVMKTWRQMLHTR